MLSTRFSFSPKVNLMGMLDSLLISVSVICTIVVLAEWKPKIQPVVLVIAVIYGYMFCYFAQILETLTALPVRKILCLYVLLGLLFDDWLKYLPQNMQLRTILGCFLLWPFFVKIKKHD